MEHETYWNYTLCRRPYIWLERNMFRWPGVLEISWSWRGAGLALELIDTGDDSEDKWAWMVFLHLLFVKVFLHLPFRGTAYVDAQGYRHYGEWKNWGLRIDFERMSGIWIERGKRRALNVKWPWHWDFMLEEVLLPGGEWVDVCDGSPRLGRTDAWAAEQAIRAAAEHWTYPYNYKLKNGEVQCRAATLFVVRRTWRWRWLKWTNWRGCTKVSTTIDVSFDDEVGERAGGWKGGCTGCDYEMRPGETPEDTLRRMERERKF